MSADNDRSHPVSQAAPLTAHEQTALAGLAAGNEDLLPLLAWPAAALSAGTGLRGSDGRRLLGASGWPAWLALLAGVALAQLGVRRDSGWPLLFGAVLVLTFNHWVLLPPLTSMPQSVRGVLAAARKDPPGAKQASP